MKPATLVLRFDDIVELTPPVHAGWSLLEDHNIPIHLGVSPCLMELDHARQITKLASGSRVPVEVHQHGHRHTNHGTEDRKFEFGDLRGISAQRAEIDEGRKRMVSLFGDLFVPVFSPSFDRYGLSTLKALVDCGMRGISVKARVGEPNIEGLDRIPMTMDPIRWRPTPVHQPWAETQQGLEASLARIGHAGLTLHPERMEPEDFLGLNDVLGHLLTAGVQCPPMSSWLQGTERKPSRDRTVP